MRILANRKIKQLFICILLIVVAFSSISVAAVSLQWQFAARYVLVSAICMGVFIFLRCMSTLESRSKSWKAL